MKKYNFLFSFILLCGCGTEYASTENIIPTTILNEEDVSNSDIEDVNVPIEDIRYETTETDATSETDVIDVPDILESEVAEIEDVQDSFESDTEEIDIIISDAFDTVEDSAQDIEEIDVQDDSSAEDITSDVIIEDILVEAAEVIEEVFEDIFIPVDTIQEEIIEDTTIFVDTYEDVEDITEEIVEPGGCFSLEFEGLDSVTMLGGADSPYMLSDTDFTVEMWVFSYTENEGFNGLIGNNNTCNRRSSDCNGWLFFSCDAEEGRGAVNPWIRYFDFVDGPLRVDWSDTEGATTIPYNQWSHLAFVYDNSTRTIKYYLNGIRLPARFDIRTRINPSIQNLIIGNQTVPFRIETSEVWGGWNGLIGPVRISNIERYSGNFIPETEWENDYFTIGLWLMNEGVGDSVLDLSSNERNGHITGASWVDYCP